MNESQSYYFKSQHHEENSLDHSGESRDVNWKPLLKYLQFNNNATCGHAWLFHFPYVHPASYRELNILFIWRQFGFIAMKLECHWQTVSYAIYMLPKKIK